MKKLMWPVMLVLAFVSFGNLHAQQLTLEDFEKKLSSAKSPQILDVRSPLEFAENHLKGAQNFYVPDDETLLQQIKKLDRSKPVFVYSINNGRSTIVSKKLLDAGFTDVYPLPGGLAHWIGAGKPIESSAGRGLTHADFTKLIPSEEVIIVDIGSKHCGGCKKLEPIVDQVSKEGGVKVLKIELYDNRQLAKELNIESVPTLIVYKGSKPVWRKSGAITKDEISDALEKSL